MNDATIPVKGALTICLLAAITCLNGCAPVRMGAQQGLVAKGLLLGEPCEPPCWQGLIPGVSTEEEVDEFLTTSEYVDPHIDRRTYGRGVAIWWQPRWESRGENMFDVQSGILEIMRMYADSEVTLGQLVDRYGPPDKFQAGRSAHPEPVYINVDLFYRELGIWLNLHLSTDDRELRRETELVRVWYFQPAALEDVVATSLWGKGEPLEDEQLEVLAQQLRGWRDWQGYGTVELTYRFGEK